MENRYSRMHDKGIVSHFGTWLTTLANKQYYNVKIVHDNYSK